jgi:hypothetical protein
MMIRWSLPMAGQRIMVSKPDDDSEGDIAELKKAFRKRGGCSTALIRNGPLPLE